MRKEERRTYWKQIVDEQAASGLEGSAFCRKHNIKIPQFYRWRSKFQNIYQERTTASFIQLIPNARKPESGIRIRVFENVFIEIDRGFDPVTLCAAVETLHHMG
jgi:hypothetical protein